MQLVRAGGAVAVALLLVQAIVCVQADSLASHANVWREGLEGKEMVWSKNFDAECFCWQGDPICETVDSLFSQLKDSPLYEFDYHIHYMPSREDFKEAIKPYQKISFRSGHGHLQSPYCFSKTQFLGPIQLIEKWVHRTYPDFKCPLHDWVGV